jgi:pyruvate decarboxylase
MASEERTTINLKSFLTKATKALDTSKMAKPDVSSLGNFRTIEPRTITNLDDPIDQTSFYLRLNSYLRPNDTVLLANATPILGGRDLILPPGATTIASGQWFSIGHMLPAAQGASLAQQSATSPANSTSTGRTILLEGDGSFQVTAQELSTIIRYQVPMTIFIINNSGYAYERQIHGMHEEYNDLAPWRYSDGPRWFGAEDYEPQGEVRARYPIYTTRIETWRDLDRLLEDPGFSDGKGLKLVDVVVGKYDIPEKFRQVFASAGKNLG